MADGPGHYGSGHEDLDREIAALDKIAPKVEDFNKRREAEVSATDRSTASLKGNAKAREENAKAMEREAAAARKLSDAQAKLLSEAVTSGAIRPRGGGLQSARSLERQGLLEGPVNGPFTPTDVGALVAQQRGLIQQVATQAAVVAAAAAAKVNPAQYQQAAGPHLPQKAEDARQRLNDLTREYDEARRVQKRLSDAQRRFLARLEAAGQAGLGYAGAAPTARSLVRRDLAQAEGGRAWITERGRGVHDPNLVVGDIQQQRLYYESLRYRAGSAGRAQTPQATGQVEAVSRQAIAAEEAQTAATQALTEATRAEAAARTRAARHTLALEGAAAGTLGIFATGAGAALRFGIREGRTGQRVSGNFASREAAEARIAALLAEAIPAVEATVAAQRRIAVTAGMELARRERIAGKLAVYEAALRAQPVIPEGRQIGPGGSLLPMRHPTVFGQQDYGVGSRAREVERTRQEFERLGRAAVEANTRYEAFRRTHEATFASGRVPRAIRAEHDALRQSTMEAIQDAGQARNAYGRARAAEAGGIGGQQGHRYQRPFAGPDYGGAHLEFGPGVPPYVPRYSNEAYDRFRDYYVGGGGPPRPRGPSGTGGTRPTPRELPEFSASSHAEEAARHSGELNDSFINRVRTANAAADAMGRYADVESRAAGATRLASAEFGTADRSMYKHGALTTEFIQAAYRGEVTMRDLGNQVALTVGKFAGWTVAASAVYGVVRAISTLGNGALASNSAVAELQRYIGGLDTDRAREQLRGLSEDLNVDMDTAAKQFAAAARLTGRIQDPREAQDAAASIAHTTLLLSRVGDIEPDDAMKFTQALQVGFRLSADELKLLVDQMNELQNKMNIPLDVSSGALSRAAGTWRAAGGSAENLLALTAAGRRGTGFSGEILGTTFSRAATLIGRPSNRAQLQGFGIDPDQTIDQIMEQAMRLVETRQVSGRDVIRLGTALSSPQLAGRGVVAALQNTAEYRRAQKLEDPGTAAGSAEKELNQMLKSWREQIVQVANGLRQLGGALEQSGLLAPLAIMLKTLNGIADVVQFLIGGFNDILPPGLRQGVALLLEAAAAMAVLRRLGAFRAEGALARNFPQLASLEKPENQVKGLAVRGARDQVEAAEAAREGATRRYRDSRVDYEVRTRDLGQMQQELRDRERGTDPRWVRGGELHGGLSQKILTSEKELEALEGERAAALRQTLLHQDVVKRAKTELRDMERMSPAEAAFYARATGTPLPASLRIPEERGAKAATDRLKSHLENVPLTGRPSDVLKHIDDVERMLDETVTTRPSATRRLRDSAFGQRASKVAQAMRDEIAAMHENLRPKAYVYDPQGASAWNVGPQPDGRYFNSDTSARTMRDRVRRLDRTGPGRLDNIMDSASRGAYNLGGRVTGLASSAGEFARNSRLLSGASTLAGRTLNAGVTAVEAAIGGMRRGAGGMRAMWASMGALDKVFLGLMAWQVAESLTQPAGDEIRRQDQEQRKRGIQARNQKDREQLARRGQRGVTGGDVFDVAIGGVGQILNPTQWDDIVGGRDVGTIRRHAIEMENARSQTAAVALQAQARARRRGQPLPYRFSGDIARDARRLMAEQSSFTVSGDYEERMRKLQEEAESATMEGRNAKERERSRQRLAQVMADLGSSADDRLAVRRQFGTLDEPALQKAAGFALTEVSAYGLHGTRSRQYVMQAQEAYLAAVNKMGRGTPEQLGQLAQVREQYFQGIASAAQADLAIALDAAGADPSKRAAAFGQSREDVSRNTVGVARRSLADARRRQGTLREQVSGATAAQIAFSSTGDTGMVRHMQARLLSLQSRLEGVNVEVGKKEDEVELTERLFKAFDIDERHRASQDREAGRQRRADLRASRTDDPLVQAREQTRRAQQNLRDRRDTFGADSPEAQEAETALNQARNTQFQAHLQDIQSRGRLDVAQGTRDTIGRARNQVTAARRALAYARQHRARHPVAYREALIALDQAEETLDDATQSRAESITDLEGRLAVSRAHGDPLVAAQQALRAAGRLRRRPNESGREFGLRQAVARQDAINQGQDAERDLHAAIGEWRSSVSGDPRDQAQAELENAQSELRDASRGTAAWWRARAKINQARRQVQKADADMASARLELRRAGTDDPVAQARIDEQIARQGISGTTGAERIRARARLREAHRNTLQTSVTARTDTVDFNLAMEKITADQAASQLESLARSHGIGKAMRRDLLRRAHDLRKQSEQEASGFALDVGTIKLPTIYDVRRAMAPLRQGADLGASARMNAVTNMNLTINAGDGPGAEERVYAGVDRAMGTALRATMRSVQMR